MWIIATVLHSRASLTLSAALHCADPTLHSLCSRPQSPALGLKDLEPSPRLCLYIVPGFLSYCTSPWSKTFFGPRFCLFICLKKP